MSPIAGDIIVPLSMNATTDSTKAETMNTVWLRERTSAASLSGAVDVDCSVMTLLSLAQQGSSEGVPRAPTSSPIDDKAGSPLAEGKSTTQLVEPEQPFGVGVGDLLLIDRRDG